MKCIRCVWRELRSSEYCNQITENQCGYRNPAWDFALKTMSGGCDINGPSWVLQRQSTIRETVCDGLPNLKMSFRGRSAQTDQSDYNFQMLVSNVWNLQFFVSSFCNLLNVMTNVRICDFTIDLWIVLDLDQLRLYFHRGEVQQCI